MGSVGQFISFLDSDESKTLWWLVLIPWGGTNYLQMKQADISEFPLDGFHIYLYCLNKLKCKNIVYFLPRNCNIDQILYMAGPGGVCEIEQNFLGYKLVALSAYYGYELNNQVQEQDLQE